MNNSNLHIKRALLSVSDKSGILEFAQFLLSHNIEIISTGGTYTLLKSQGISVKNISEVTGFPEIMDGRVKTLHPKIHGGLLANLGNDEHRQALESHDITSIDLVVVNLYPFESTLANPASTPDDIIENIDIGGPAMLRASAKNYQWTVVVTSPDQYDQIQQEMTENAGAVTLTTRQRLATIAFSLTSYYDARVSEYFTSQSESTSKPKYSAIPLVKFSDLRYGENPHQEATLFGTYEEIYSKLHGKELSFNNILDIDAAVGLNSEFEEPAVVIVKHTNPCGVAVGSSLKAAYVKAFETDTKSPFGGIIAFNRQVDIETAQTVHDLFAEVLIAPSFTEEALALLVTKKQRRILTCDFAKYKEKNSVSLRSVAGGLLWQTVDSTILDSHNSLRVVSKRKPTESELSSMIFATKVAKHVKSNAIVYASAERALAIGAGQMSRVDSALIATEKARQFGISLSGSSVASEAFLPFADSVEEVVKAGATAIIQPGGSVRDAEVIEAADKYNIAMIFTGIRHFKH